MANWKDIVRGIAPTLATALGGPAAGAAVSALSRVFLGKSDGTQDELDARLSGPLTPEDELKLKAAEQDYVKSLIDAATKLEAIEAQDREGARQREEATHDATTHILAYAVIILLATALIVLSVLKIPTDNRDALNQLIGVLYLAVGNVLGYYFGTSAGSKAKDVVLGKLASAKGA